MNKSLRLIFATARKESRPISRPPKGADSQAARKNDSEGRLTSGRTSTYEIGFQRLQERETEYTLSL